MSVQREFFIVETAVEDTADQNVCVHVEGWTSHNSKTMQTASVDDLEFFLISSGKTVAEIEAVKQIILGRIADEEPTLILKSHLQSLGLVDAVLEWAQS